MNKEATIIQYLEEFKQEIKQIERNIKSDQDIFIQRVNQELKEICEVKDRLIELEEKIKAENIRTSAIIIDNINKNITKNMAKLIEKSDCIEKNSEKIIHKVNTINRNEKEKTPLFFEEEKEETTNTTLKIKNDDWKPIELIRPRIGFLNEKLPPNPDKNERSYAFEPKFWNQL
jgi:hypothetical protein